MAGRSAPPPPTGPAAALARWETPRRRCDRRPHSLGPPRPTQRPRRRNLSKWPPPPLPTHANARSTRASLAFNAHPVSSAAASSSAAVRRGYVLLMYMLVRIRPMTRCVFFFDRLRHGVAQEGPRVSRRGGGPAQRGRALPLRPCDRVGPNLPGSQSTFGGAAARGRGGGASGNARLRARPREWSRVLLCPRRSHQCSRQRARAFRCQSSGRLRAQLARERRAECDSGDGSPSCRLLARRAAHRGAEYYSRKNHGHLFRT